MSKPPCLTPDSHFPEPLRGWLVRAGQPTLTGNNQLDAAGQCLVAAVQAPVSPAPPAPVGPDVEHEPPDNDGRPHLQTRQRDSTSSRWAASATVDKRSGRGYHRLGCRIEVTYRDTTATLPDVTQCLRTSAPTLAPLQKPRRPHFGPPNR